MKVLFICNQNQNRSKTAEELFRNRYKTKSAGLFNNRPVSKKQIEWADLIIVMDDNQRSEIAKRFPKLYMQKRILSLNIGDIYSYGDIRLIEELNKKMMQIAEPILANR
ncbi:phosphotyrosine protein phosphatase [Candidatus Woesearchaeota archaeon]|nr:phosphotyrosine protein phosphatase [Candidatus Woesearchaeota archaeon]